MGRSCFGDEQSGFSRPISRRLVRAGETAMVLESRLERIPQPCPRAFPVSLDRAGRDAEGQCGLLGGETCIEPALDDVHQSRIDLLEAVERIVGGNGESRNGSPRKITQVVECDVRRPRTTLECHTLSNCVDHNVAHRGGRGRQEVAAVTPPAARTIDETDEGFVHEFRRVEGPRTRTQLPTGDQLQVAIDQLYGALEGAIFTALISTEPAGDVVGAAIAHVSFRELQVSRPAPRTAGDESMTHCSRSRQDHESRLTWTSNCNITVDNRVKTGK